jgi:hypothetical protein
MKQFFLRMGSCATAELSLQEAGPGPQGSVENTLFIFGHTNIAWDILMLKKDLLFI